VDGPSKPHEWIAGARNLPERLGIQSEIDLNLSENSFIFHFMNFPLSAHAVAGVLQTIPGQPSGSFGPTPPVRQNQERSTFLTDPGAFSPRSCSYRGAYFVFELKILIHRIVPPHGENYSEIDEEPLSETVRLGRNTDLT
jgi:hypothetical protein